MTVSPDETIAAAAQLAARAHAERRRAEQYGEFFSPVTARFLPPLVDRLPTGGGHAVDIGTGRGELARLLAERGWLLTALDRSALMAAAARSARVRPVVADAHALPLADDSVDALVGAFVLPHLVDPPRAMTEFARVIRPGGTLALLGWADAGRSPFTGLASDLLASHAAPDVRDLLAAARERTDPQWLTTTVRDASFRRIEVATVSLSVSIPSPMAWWKGMVGASSGFAELWQRTDLERRRAVQAAFMAAADEYADGAGLRVPVAARLLVARAPGTPS
jgi:SAM-dependent methyltransferase